MTVTPTAVILAPQDGIPEADRALPIIRPDMPALVTFDGKDRPGFYDGQRVWVRGLFANTIMRGVIRGFAGRCEPHDAWIVDFGAIIGNDADHMYKWSCAVIAHTRFLVRASAKEADRRWGFANTQALPLPESEISILDNEPGIEEEEE